MFEGYPLKMIARFEFFHAANPQVYVEFVRRTIGMHKTGKRKYGARCFIELIRHDHDINVKGEEVFKINDNFTPMYARKFMAENPKYAGFFNTRAVTSEGKMSNEEYRRKRARK